MDNQTDAEWIKANLGPFSQLTTYADLKALNLSDVSLFLYMRFYTNCVLSFNEVFEKCILLNMFCHIFF